jgi:hypothetical protein
MRKKLKAIGSETRHRYHATVGRMGIKDNIFKRFPQRTMLLKNVASADTGEILTDHLWVTVGETLKKLKLKEGDEITFDARVGTYKKGRRYKKTDYKLNYMTKIEVKYLDRELNIGEITSDTEPSFEELDKVREMKQKEREEMEEMEEYEYIQNYYQTIK